MEKVSEKRQNVFEVNNQQGATTECGRLLWLPLTKSMADMAKSDT